MASAEGASRKFVGPPDSSSEHQIMKSGGPTDHRQKKLVAIPVYLLFFFVVILYRISLIYRIIQLNRRVYITLLL